MSKRTPLIVGNWKMNKNNSQTSDYIKKFLNGIDTTKKREIGLAPVFTSLITASDLLKGSNVSLCAQNVHWDESGQYTGEVSPSMLKELGVESVIVGHSERRKFFGETNESVNNRLKGALKGGLKVIFCVGETKEEREAGRTETIVRAQVLAGLDGIGVNELANIVIAYEPVWAIGTGLNATVEQAVEVHRYIRKIIDALYGEGTSSKLRILYGGSVKPDNIDGFMAQDDIDGALVGGASLEFDSFLRIVNFKDA